MWVYNSLIDHDLPFTRSLYFLHQLHQNVGIFDSYTAEVLDPCEQAPRDRKKKKDKRGSSCSSSSYGPSCCIKGQGQMRLQLNGLPCADLKFWPQQCFKVDNGCDKLKKLSKPTPTHPPAHPHQKKNIYIFILFTVEKLLLIFSLKPTALLWWLLRIRLWHCTSSQYSCPSWCNAACSHTARIQSNVFRRTHQASVFRA